MQPFIAVALITAAVIVVALVVTEYRGVRGRRQMVCVVGAGIATAIIVGSVVYGVFGLSDQGSYEGDKEGVSASDVAMTIKKDFGVDIDDAQSEKIAETMNDTGGAVVAGKPNFRSESGVLYEYTYDALTRRIFSVSPVDITNAIGESG